MEAATLRPLHALPATAPAVEDWDWLYDDPDLAPFLGPSRRPRPEVPLDVFA